jgi:hypothetical protein
MHFTLCIPTMDRYDTFLSVYLLKYVTNPLINEIIITDENGNDIQKILESNIEKSKLKLYNNNKVLGPFLNKLHACKLATNEWIALIDSDNFADEDYFKISYEYIKNLINPKYDIISPSFAKPRFDYRHLSNNIITKTNLKSLIEFDKKNRGENASLNVLMNTGNFILNKSLITEINLDNEINNIPYSSACDVIYFNTLLFEQFDVKFHVLSGLEYEHVVHDGSIYITTCNNYQQFNNDVNSRFYKETPETC